MAFAVAEGVAEERIWLDPGIGFGKTVDHNLELLRRLDELVALGPPVVVGTSRKSLPRPHHRAARSPAERVAGTVATNVLALERGRHGLPRPRRPPRPAMRCSVAAATLRRHMAPDDDEPDFDDLTEDDDEDGPEIGVTIEIVGLSLYTHHGVTAAEREIGQRLVLDVRFDVGEVGRAGHRPRRGHRRLRRGLPGDRARRPAALLQDARAPVRGDRRPPRRALRRRVGHGQGRQARAADPAAGRGGLGRGLARGVSDR